MGGIGANEENVKFSHADAQTLITACNNAATAIDGQGGSRQSWRATGEDQFTGYFSTLFQSNGSVQVKDAAELSSALRGVAKLTGELQKAADAEQQRRQKARDWENEQKHKNIFEKGLDDVSHLWGGNEPPVPPAAPQLRQTAAQPSVGKRETPQPGSGGGGSTGTSSAVPDNLRKFATGTSGGDQTLSTHQSAVQKAYSAFSASCGWGSLDASGVLAGFTQYLQANADEVKWANTIASAFERAGGSGSVCTLSNQALGAALQAAHVAATRADLKIDLPSVLGGVPTSGFADDPVNTATGNFTEPEIDLDFSDACADLFFGRMYNSASSAVGAFGPGWSSWPESRLLLGEAEARWVLPEGRHIVFPVTADGWERAAGASYWLARDGESLHVTDNSGGSWAFSAEGRLEFFSRGEGTRVDAMYQADGRFIGLVHERGRSVSVEWSGDRIVAATASDERRVAYGYDAQGRLIEASGPRGQRRYVWGEAGLVEQVVDGDGVVEVLNGYDAQGRVAWQRSPFGRISRYTYLPGGVTEVADTDGERSNTWIADGAGRLIGVIDADGHRQSYSWDADGNMVAATDRVGQRTTREYDDRGRLTREVTASGADLQYGYDEQDRVITVAAGAADGAGGDAVTTYEYDGQGRNPSLIIDSLGGRTTLLWERGLLTQVTDPTGVTLRFGFDAHGELVSTTNAVGDTARLERDDAGRVVAAVTPLGNRTAYEYDESGVLVSRRDPDGAVWRFEHTAAGRISAQIAPDGGRTEIEYGATGEETRTVDPLGRVISRELDDLGNLAAVKLPDGSTWSYTHDALSRLLETVDPLGGVWANRYDADGAPTATVDPTGVTRRSAVNRTENSVTVDDGLMSSTLTRDALGRPRTVQSSGDDEQTYVYDASGNVVEVLDAEGGLTLIRRDLAGRPVEVVDPEGVTTGYVYDACGRLTQVIGTDGAVTTREYDADSRVVRQTLPTGDAAWAEYDACGRVTRLHQPGSGTASYSYDACGRVVFARDIWSGIRRFSYDQAGQLVAVANGLGGVTRYAYDDNGRLAAITDPVGGVTRRRWDAMSRLVAETDPLGRTTTAGYDAAGRQTWQESPDGHRISFGFDESGREISTSVDGTLVASITRDLTARTAVIEDRTGSAPVTHVQEFDRVGRLIRHSRMAADGTGGELRWDYDRAGRRTSMADAFGRETSYTYDAAGRLARVEHATLGTVVLTHDPLGRLTTAITTDAAGQATQQAWQWADGQVVGHTASGSAGSAETAVARDEEGRITAITRDGVTTRYSYDAAEQLIAAIGDGTAESWSFDQNGRLTQFTADGLEESYGYDAAGQLLSAQRADGTTTTYEYDASGERTRSIRSDGVARGFAWTPTGRLAGVAASGDATGTALHVDALGQLAQAGVDALWWDTAAAVPTLVGIGETPVLPLGAATGIGAQWATPGWRASRADTGNPWQVDPVVSLPGGFGVTATGTLTLGGQAGFDPLEWLGTRAYDPGTHGFLAVDPVPPVTGAGWAANPYNYAGNNPLAFSDPTGLHPLTDDELTAQTKGWLSDAWNATTSGLSTAWHAVSKWATTGWGAWLLGGAMAAGGIALMATGVGGPAGAMLLSAGADTLIQKATTGTVNYGEVALVGVSGGVGDFGVAARVGMTGVKAAVTSGAISGAVTGAGLGEYNYWMGDGPHTALGSLEHAGTGAVIGAATGAASSGLTDVVGNKVDSVVTTKLHPDGVHVPKHIALPKHAAPPAHPTSIPGRLTGAAAAHLQAGALAGATDYATGDDEPAGYVRAGLVGGLIGSPEGTYHAQHLAR